MNILAINLALAAPSLGPTYRTHHLANLWAERGHHVTVVGSTFSHLLSKSLVIRDSRLELRENGVRYLLLKAPPYKGSGIGRLWNIATLMMRLRLLEGEIARHYKPDVVIAGSVYQLDNYSGFGISRKSGGVFVRETRDLWPLTLLEIGGYSRMHPFVAMVQRAEDFGYRNATFVSTTLAASKQYMITRGLSEDRWIYLPQCPPPTIRICETSTRLPAEHQDFFERARRSCQLILIFAGSFVPASDLLTVFEAARILKGKKIQFVFVGKGPLLPALTLKIQKDNLSNVTLLPNVDKPLVSKLLQLSDAGIQAFQDSPIYQYGISPNKVFEYMSNGLPMILCCNSPGNVISESGGGFVVPPRNPQALAAAAQQLSEMSAEERAFMGQKAKEFIHQKHSLDTVADDYLKLFSNSQPEVK